MNDALHMALARFRRERDLDKTRESRRIWLATLGGLIVPLPNFRWRREILARHDLHHLITGYETTRAGELSLAAWELGVGCYASIWARLLCSGLMMTGMITQLRETMRAFRHGRQSADAYGHGTEAVCMNDNRPSV